MIYVVGPQGTAGRDSLLTKSRKELRFKKKKKTLLRDYILGLGTHGLSLEI